MPLKYLHNFWRTLEIPLVNCKINILLTWSDKCIIATGCYSDREPKFAITDTKLYVPVVTLTAQDNEKLLQQFNTFLKEQLTGITINQIQHHRHETDF